MTCIVGVEDGTDVVLGADSGIGYGADLRDRVRGKAWIVDGVGMAGAGSVRAIQALRYGLSLPAQPASMGDAEWLVRRFATAVRAELVAELRADSDGAEVTPPDLIVALNGGLYEMDGDYAIHRASRGYASIGSGCEVALGALRATRGKSATARARTAVACAIEHVSTCSLPIEVLRVPSRRQRRRA